ncbi:MAG: hypothetical protein J5702_05020 [Bacteroidales bacterium]|nr:hypothetical protein [Bacteroidales bacterium]
MKRFLFFAILYACCFLPAGAVERVWVSCDRSLYAAGETIWLRGWVEDTDAAAELPASKFLYVELLRDGQGSVEQRIKLKERSGMFFGQMELAEGLESGWYTLRAYTRAQKDWPAEALFHTRLLVRGVGTLPELIVPQPKSVTDTPSEIQVELTQASDGRLSVALTDSEGNPVPGNFSIAVVKGRYADFDFQTEPAVAVDDAGLPEGNREYAQELDFRVRSVRSRLPDSYSVAIMSQDIGYYYSTEVAGDRTVKGSEGQSFRIPDLDFPEGTLFTINTAGSKYISPAGESDENAFAPPFDYGPTYPERASIRDTAAIRAHLEGTVAPLPADDTITASRIVTQRKPAFYRPERMVGPFSNVFEWRQVKLREELKKYDDMDLMTYIVATWPTFVCTFGGGLVQQRTLYTTRSGSFSQRVVVSHGSASYKNTAGYSPVGLYIDGMRQKDWSEATNMTIRDVQNLYVLRGTEAALYKEAAVVLLERRRFDEKMLEEARREGSRKTIGLLPLGYQRPKSFDASPALNPERQGTLYWNPCIRTDAAGHADISLPDLPDTYYLRLEGQTLDGRYFLAIGGSDLDICRESSR